MKLSHPFIAELKRYVANQNATLGPIVMNLCDLIRMNRLKPEEQDKVLGKQRKLSQVTDMIHAAHVFHRCVRDNSNIMAAATATATAETSSFKRLHQDNVMSLLVGDYLLAQSSVDMADLRYPKTVGFIAKGLEDYTRGEFLKLQLVDNFNKNKQRIDPADIGRYAQLTCGSLLSNACHSAALLAGYTDQDQVSVSTLVRSFGFHTGSAHRLIEILYLPDTNSEDDRGFIEALDSAQLDATINSHLDESIRLLFKMPQGEKRPILLEMLNRMKTYCSS